ncbi:type 4a pilus biogenesis protein PilO [Methylonatrum kenyense]|uniref:type 4a pilus biogenesis protein PilO n=1 Tax=Methylonatrum kenyense TaxID=455253 RepID=UPI0020C04289|nr:type 4a pilus biogenesis protein PilO [Methylonatrum kenyense]MCK8516849.1 type 4a pilus biogenesis protein PilO [Methylonatrum kenyense]
MKVQGVELSELDLNNTGSWPPVIKFLAALLVCAAVVAAGWYFSWQDQQQQLVRVEAQEPQLRGEFETKQGRAANLGAYEELLDEMERSLEARLRELPSRVEVPPLLVDISQAGLGAGLEFELFRPGSSVRRDFYAEMPIQIRVRGRFHEFGRFVSDVANLPRIVTLHDVEIRRGGDNGELTMSATARTYWYLDDEGEDES